MDPRYRNRTHSSPDKQGERTRQIPAQSQDPPPYNGWGDEEDSLGNCYSLHPKAPRKDLAKLIGKEGEILRFSAKMKEDPNARKPVNAKRDFVVSFFLQDDTVSVFELPIRNSGFIGGKFIQRAKVRNAQAGNRFFEAADFGVGEEVCLNGYIFILGNADEYALNYMEANSISFPQSDLSEIISKIRNNFGSTQNIKNAFEDKDPGSRGYIETDAAESLLVNDFSVTQQEALTIIRRWTDEKGFNYSSFLDAMR